MKVAVASMGTSPDALVGARFGMCSQFVVFDPETDEFLIVRVPPHAQDPDRVSVAAIRAIAQQDVSVVITGQIKDICRQTMQQLGIDVIEGVGGMTVREAIQRYRSGSLQEPGARQGFVTKVAVVSGGEDLDGRIETPMGLCSAFVVVDPQTDAWEVVRIEPEGPPREINLEGVRAIVRSGAYALITPEIHPECCAALQALAVIVYTAPSGITVREAIEMYKRGELEERVYSL